MQLLPIFASWTTDVKFPKIEESSTVTLAPNNAYAPTIQLSPKEQPFLIVAESLINVLLPINTSTIDPSGFSC